LPCRIYFENSREIMEVIHIKQPQDEKIGSLVYELIDYLAFFNQNSGDELLIDLGDIQFLYPLQILPLVAVINQKICEKKSVFIRYPANQSYFNKIRFYEGFNISDYPNLLNELFYYRDKHFIPIFSIPASQSIETQEQREHVLSAIDDILSGQLRLSSRFRSPLNYLITEAIDNICDHAKVENGWIMIQNYPQYGFLDICICDNGVSILGSYTNSNYSGISSDEKAIQQALIGKSTKYQSISRGFGISTSRNMLVNGLSGEYFIFSGSAFYIQNKEHDQIVKTAESCKWNGTLVALRIPTQMSTNFNFYDFIN